MVGASCALSFAVGAGKYSRTPYTTNFQMGMMAATYVGVANGSFMTPLKYANQVLTIILCPSSDIPTSECAVCGAFVEEA